MIEEKEKIIGLIKALHPKVKIYLFGSRASGKAHERSDIDLALDVGQKLTIPEIAQIKNVLEALNIPQGIDIVDMHRIPESLKIHIVENGIIWKD